MGPSPSSGMHHVITDRGGIEAGQVLWLAVAGVQRRLAAEDWQEDRPGGGDLPDRSGPTDEGR